MLLHFNNLEGSLPPSLMNCTSLIELNLGFNNFEGEISTLNFSKLSQLSKLDLGSNSFSAHLPISLYPRAMKILMGSKSLATLLPYSFVGEEMPTDEDMVGFDRFENLRILAWMNFDSNLISGEFPKELCKLPMLVSEQAAAQVDHNFLELPIFIQPDGAQALQYTYLSFLPPSIYLHNNSISGSIPVEIGGLQLLHALDLSNNFSGEIPDQISNLKNMDTVDLSVNHLSGKIPTSLRSLNFLSFFNVSYNNLEGQYQQLQGFNASAFEGNQKLCGNKNNQDVDNGHEIPWFYISLALGFIVGFWGVCGPLMFKKRWGCAYFQFSDNVQDRLYVMITVCVAAMQRRVRI
ncbi:LOW QUALITY PROTEIN: hypothetical protein PRUPE_8G027500 [Prunus persica]|uniref:Leucine-rich repeat-containing N-terminal plant-type domain-containing protein n=1 Tax=Prunus persica TaxID=3760 RepID=A0A251MUN5_PRUPE|nr:LOW QUALITY PROTEIN: hypothetical protein PRUPE_8G027500 [Prunus persica]